MPSLPSFCSAQDLPSCGQKVILGISGGVDSAAAASILQSNGAEVLCVFLKLFDGATKALTDAEAVTQFLGLPLRVVDCQIDFENEIIKPFVETYCRGETPIPCAWCNPQIKFSTFYKIAQDENAEYVATGHYARIQKHQGLPVLYPSKISRQDQSYFLYGLSSQQLTQAIFPLGNASKTEVRAYAERVGIPVFKKADSQDICFLSLHEKNYTHFIENFLKTHPSADLQNALLPGKILDTTEKTVGQHRGIIHYTIGQRRGLGVAAPDPLYVFKIEGNLICVGPKEQLGKQSLKLTNFKIHPFSSFFLKKTEKNPVFCQFRSTMPAISATFEWKEEEDPWVTFDSIQYGVAPGQACVLRDTNGAIFGGGIISKTE